MKPFHDLILATVIVMVVGVVAALAFTAGQDRYHAAEYASIQGGR